MLKKNDKNTSEVMQTTRRVFDIFCGQVFLADVAVMTAAVKGGSGGG